MRGKFDPEGWRRWKMLFEQAADADAVRQEELLDQHCQGDIELRKCFATMLSAHRQSSAMLDRSLPERFLALSVEQAEEPPASTPPLSRGTLLKDRYLIEKVIGGGGWSMVYLALDEVMERRNVVVKVLLRQSAQRSAIDDEIAALSRVHHPGIAAPLDSGATPDGRRFLVLAYIPGITLRAALHESGPMEAGLVVRLLRAMGSALASAHDEGVCHLDLKPENIMLRGYGNQIDPVIVDFGISRLLQAPGAATSPPAGSLAYIAPEQLEGEPGAASDQYSLALVAAEMLTGRKPPPLGSAPAILAACGGLPLKARLALDRALSASPANRFPDIDAFVTALAITLDPERRRYRRLSTAALLAVTILLASGVTSFWMARRHERQLVTREMGTISEQMAVWVRLADSAPFPQAALEQAFQGPLAHMQRLVAEGHREQELLMTLSNSLALYGTYLGHPGRRSIGQSEKGIAALRQSLEVAQILGEVALDRWWWRGFTAEKYDMLASILIEAGEYNQAADAARQGLSLLENFKATGAGYRNLASIQGGVYMTLSRVHFHRREFEECLRLRDLGVASRREMLVLDKNARPARYDLAGVLATRGYLLRDMGRLADAHRDYAESEALIDTILREEAWNLQYRWLHARNSMELGKLYLLGNQNPKAVVRLTDGVNLMRAMLKDSPHEISSLRSYALCLSWLAVAKSHKGSNRAEAGALIAEALQVNQTALDRDPRSAKTRDEREVILQNARDAGVVRLVQTSQIPPR
ncbi:MAG: serine/threonine protein kinase [Bryobacterales bacterium]|nr:serine/threonine protein kinase [Bryobacterales bacterium]